MINSIAVMSTLGSFALGAMCFSLLRVSPRYQQFFEARALAMPAPLDPGKTSPVAEMLAVSIRRIIAVVMFVTGPGIVYAVVRWLLPQRLPLRFDTSIAAGMPSLHLADQSAWVWAAGVSAVVFAYFVIRRIRAVPDPDTETDPPLTEWPLWAVGVNLAGIAVHAAALEWILRGALYALLVPAGADLAIGAGAVVYGLSRLPDGPAVSFGSILLSAGAGVIVYMSGSLVPVIVGHILFASLRFALLVHRNPAVSLVRS